MTALRNDIRTVLRRLTDVPPTVVSDVKRKLNSIAAATLQSLETARAAARACRAVSTETEVQFDAGNRAVTLRAVSKESIRALEQELVFTVASTDNLGGWTGIVASNDLMTVLEADDDGVLFVSANATGGTLLNDSVAARPNQTVRRLNSPPADVSIGLRVNLLRRVLAVLGDSDDVLVSQSELKPRPALAFERYGTELSVVVATTSTGDLLKAQQEQVRQLSEAAKLRQGERIDMTSTAWQVAREILYSKLKATDDVSIALAFGKYMRVTISNVVEVSVPLRHRGRIEPLLRLASREDVRTQLHIAQSSNAQGLYDTAIAAIEHATITADSRVVHLGLSATTFIFTVAALTGAETYVLVPKESAKNEISTLWANYRKFFNSRVEYKKKLTAGSAMAAPLVKGRLRDEWYGVQATHVFLTTIEKNDVDVLKELIRAATIKRPAKLLTLQRLSEPLEPPISQLFMAPPLGPYAYPPRAAAKNQRMLYVYRSTPAPLFAPESSRASLVTVHAPAATTTKPSTTPLTCQVGVRQWHCPYTRQGEADVVAQTHYVQSLARPRG